MNRLMIWGIILTVVLIGGFILWKRRQDTENEEASLETTLGGELMTINPRPMLRHLKSIQIEEKTTLDVGAPEEYYRILLQNLSEDEDKFISEYLEAIKTGLELKKTRYLRLIHAQEKAEIKRKPESFLSTLINNNQSLDNEVGGLERRRLQIFQAIIEKINHTILNLSHEIVAERMKSLVLDRENGLETLIGRDDIKNMVAKQVLAFKANPQTFLGSMQNIVIYGGSGYGKTKLAQVLAHAYCKAGILVRGIHQAITKQELTSSYINQSAKLTRSKLDETLEGVLFIDEAYDLGPEGGLSAMGLKDHGKESITEMVAFLDQFKGLSIIIAAGYKEEMERRFLAANEGMDRRFPYKVSLKPYSSEELTEILITSVHRKSFDISMEKDFVFTLMKRLHDKGTFERQAGDVLNLSSFMIQNFSLRGLSRETIVEGFNDFLRSKNEKCILVNPRANLAT